MKAEIKPFYDIDYFKNKDPLMNSLYQQIWKYNRNVLLVIAGYTGTGKSWLAVKIASLLDPTFTKETMKDRIITSPTAFLKILSNEDDSRLQKGMVIIFDEAGVGIPAREWASINNRAIDKILQTFRYRNLIVIFTVPMFSYIDTHARNLIHYYFETQKILMASKENLIKVFKLEPNTLTGDLYKKYPIFSFNGRKVKFQRGFRYKKAKAVLCNEYERIARVEKRKIQQEQRRELHAMDEKKERKEWEQAAIQKIVTDPDTYSGIYGKEMTINSAKVMGEFNINATKARYFKARAEAILRKQKLEAVNN